MPKDMDERQGRQLLLPIRTQIQTQPQIALWAEILTLLPITDIVFSIIPTLTMSDQPPKLYFTNRLA